MNEEVDEFQENEEDIEEDENKKELLNFIYDSIPRFVLKVPILNGYNIIEEDYGQIFAARSEDNSIEQYLFDGQLEEGESFDNRITKVIEETKKSMRESGLPENISYYKSFKTNLFDFRLYLQDNLVGDKLIRQLNAYFVDSEYGYFYEIVLAAPPIDSVSASSDLTTTIYNRLLTILENIEYNEQLNFE